MDFGSHKKAREGYTGAFPLGFPFLLRRGRHRNSLFVPLLGLPHKSTSVTNISPLVQLTPMLFNLLTKFAGLSEQNSCAFSNRTSSL